MIKPCCYKNIGKILTKIQKEGFKIGNLKMARFSRKDAETFYAEHLGKHFFENLMSFMTSGLVVGMELIADNCIKKWRNFIGPTNSIEAK